MSYTEQDLEKLIQSKIDDEILCERFPYLCSKVSTEQGRLRIVAFVKHLMFDEEIADIDACFVQIEQILSEPEAE